MQARLVGAFFPEACDALLGETVELATLLVEPKGPLPPKAETDAGALGGGRSLLSTMPALSAAPKGPFESMATNLHPLFSRRA